MTTRRRMLAWLLTALLVASSLGDAALHGLASWAERSDAESAVRCSAGCTHHALPMRGDDAAAVGRSRSASSPHDRDQCLVCRHLGQARSVAAPAPALAGDAQDDFFVALSPRGPLVRSRKPWSSRGPPQVAL